MKVHLLEALIDEFLTTQLKIPDTAWYFPHSIVNHFHQVWYTREEIGLQEKYDLALRSEISQRWWKRENYRPKEIMLYLIAADWELASIAFKDLFNDTATLDGRLSRFNFYSEELLQIHRKNNRRVIESHHHQDASIVSLYLAGIFPEKYSLYPGLNVFQAFSKKVGSLEITLVDDLVRFSKVSTIVFKFLQRNIHYEKFVELRTDPIHKVKFHSFQTTFEIISFAVNAKNGDAR